MTAGHEMESNTVDSLDRARLVPVPYSSRATVCSDSEAAESRAVQVPSPAQNDDNSSVRLALHRNIAERLQLSETDYRGTVCISYGNRAAKTI